MTFVLQVFLGIFCFILLVTIIRRIIDSKVIFADFSYWLIFILFLFTIAIFPKIMVFIAQTLQIQSVINAVFLIVITLLILLVLSLTFRISNLKRQTIRLIQEVSLIKEELNILDTDTKQNEQTVKQDRE